MPNPLLRRTQPNQGHQPPDRPEPTPPVLEQVAGTVFPYRGLETHGVETPVQPHGDDLPHDWDGTVDAIYETEPEHEPDPIPVRVIHQDNGSERRILRTRTVPVGNQPVRVLSRNDERVSCSMRASNAGKALGGGTAFQTTISVGSNTQGISGFSYAGRITEVTYSNPDSVGHRFYLYDNSYVIYASAYVPAGQAVTVPLSADAGRTASGATFLNVAIDANVATVPVNASGWFLPDPVNGEIRYGQSQSACETTQAYPLTDGSDVTLNTQDEVWAYAPGLPAGQFSTLYIREDLAINIP